MISPPGLASLCFLMKSQKSSVLLNYRKAYFNTCYSSSSDGCSDLVDVTFTFYLLMEHALIVAYLKSLMRMVLWNWGR